MKNHLLPIAGCCLVLAGTCFAQKKIPNYAAANLVLGQTDFVSAVDPNVASSFSLDRPEGVVLDSVSGKVFVSDYQNHRVLRYRNLNSLTNGAGAEAVFGQPSFSKNSSGAAANTTGHPIGLCLDRLGRLWVASSSHGRVLMFEAAAYRSDQPTADKVLGQPDFTTSSSGTTAAKMSDPYGVFVDAADRLWVADAGNNRVLRFDNVSAKGNGANADGVLGQVNFTNSGSATSSSGMNFPTSVTVSSTGTLYLTDYSNHRVLIFQNAAGLSNGAGATKVLGQPDFVTSTANLTATGMNEPTGLFLTPTDSLWVTDLGNNRIIRFDNVSAKVSGASADGVLCQPNFTTKTVALNIKGSLNGSYSAPFVDGAGALWIADTDHHRVLRFPPDVTLPLLTVTTIVPKKTTAKSIIIKGTASDFYGVSKVQFKVGSGFLKNATGTTSWEFKASLKKGSNTIVIFVTDAVGNVSSRTIKIKRVLPSSAPQLLVSEN
jgi:sugar lactone lactonase YvrE